MQMKSNRERRVETNAGILVFSAEDALQTSAPEVSGVVLLLVAKVAQDCNIEKWPQSNHFTASLKPSTGDILGSWEFQKGESELWRHLGYHWFFRGRRAAPHPIQSGPLQPSFPLWISQTAVDLSRKICYTVAKWLSQWPLNVASSLLPQGKGLYPEHSPAETQPNSLHMALAHPSCAELPWGSCLSWFRGREVLLHTPKPMVSA